jgi:hypothetical protein
MTQELEIVEETREMLKQALRIAKQQTGKTLINTASRLLVDLGLADELPDGLVSLSMFSRSSRRGDLIFDANFLSRVKFFLIETPSGNLALVTHVLKKNTPPNKAVNFIGYQTFQYLYDNSRILFTNTPKNMLSTAMVSYPIVKATMADYIYLHTRKLKELESENLSLKRQVSNLTEVLKRDREIQEKIEALRVYFSRISDVEAILGRLSDNINTIDVVSLAQQLSEVRSLVEAQGEKLATLGDRLLQLISEVREVKSMMKRGASTEEVSRALESIEKGLEEAKEQLPSFVQSNPWLEVLKKKGNRSSTA